MGGWRVLQHGLRSLQILLAAHCEEMLVRLCESIGNRFRRVSEQLLFGLLELIIDRVHHLEVVKVVGGVPT